MKRRKASSIAMRLVGASTRLVAVGNGAVRWAASLAQTFIVLASLTTACANAADHAEGDPAAADSMTPDSTSSGSGGPGTAEPSSAPIASSSPPDGVEPEPEGNGGEPGTTPTGTSWFSTCKLDSDCLAGNCVCGVCTSECASDEDCASTLGASRCALLDDLEYGSAYSKQCGGFVAPPSGLCLPVCEESEPCQGGVECADGLCSGLLDGSSIAPLAEAFCAAARSCCERAGFGILNLSDCEPEFTRQIEWVPDILRAAIVVEPEALRECAMAFERMATSCVWDAAVAACQSAFVPALANGEPCWGPNECASSPDGALCGLPLDENGEVTSPGTCAVATRGAEGDVCSTSCRSGEFCTGRVDTSDPSAVFVACHEDDGLSCAGSGRCEPLGALGASCEESATCPSGAFCDQMCVALRGEGESCALSEECQSNLRCTDGVCNQRPFGTEDLCAGDFN